MRSVKKEKKKKKSRFGLEGDVQMSVPTASRPPQPRANVHL